MLGLTLEQQLLIMSATIRLTEKNCKLGKMRLSDPTNWELLRKIFLGKRRVLNGVLIFSCKRTSN